LDLASAHKERTRRTVNLEETAQEGHQDEQGSAIRSVNTTAHVPDAIRRLRLYVWTLARIAGHSSIAMSYCYVHPSEDNVLDAMTIFLGGHKTGHSEQNEVQEQAAQLPEDNEPVSGLRHR
jgi:hypothetical protein